MKRRNGTILLAMALIAAMVTGCSGGNDTAADAPESTSKPVKLSWATGGTSGTYYGFGGVIAQVFNDKLSESMDITIESSGGSKANAQLVDTNSSQLAILQNDIMAYAYNASDMFEGSAPMESFSAVASCYNEVIHIAAKPGIESIADLKGKNVSVSDAGSGTEYNAKQILEAYGITFDDFNVMHMSVGDSCDALKNGTLDATFFVGGYPVVGATELGTTYNFNLLEVDDEHIAKLQEKYDFYTAATIPANTYKPVTKDTNTVTVKATIIARNDVPEEVIYEFTKGLFTYQEEIANNHSRGADLNPETAVSGIGIRFHPGAERYYKEIGAK